MTSKRKLLEAIHPGEFYLHLEQQASPESDVAAGIARCGNMK